MHEQGCLSLIVTARARFCARFAEVRLNGARLVDVEESVPRIAFTIVPDDTILVAFSLSRWPDWYWNGQEVQAGELATLGPSETVHVRTGSAIHWGAIWLDHDEFARLSQALLGAPVALSRQVCRWRPPPAALRQLISLHRFALKAAQGRPNTIGAVEAAHGLEQQLVHALADCLADGSGRVGIAKSIQPRDLMPRLEALLARQSGANMDVKSVCGALGVSDRELRRSCADRLGMSPSRYLRLRRMHAARLALRRSPPDGVKVADVAARFGFRNPGRFAQLYSDLFGEQPSTTLRRGPPRVRLDRSPVRSIGH